MGGLSLDTSLTSRDEINARLRLVLDEVTEKWGVRVTRVELKDISPPKDIQLAMEKQMQAERNKRATILQAEGEAQAAVLRAEGAQKALVLASEGQRQASILRAEGDAKALLTLQEAQAAAVRLVLEAVNGSGHAGSGHAAPVHADAAEAGREPGQQDHRGPGGYGGAGGPSNIGGPVCPGRDEYREAGGHAAGPPRRRKWHPTAAEGRRIAQWSRRGRCHTAAHRLQGTTG